MPIIVFLSTILLLISIPISCTEDAQTFKSIKNRLQRSVEQTSLRVFLELPTAETYLEYDLSSDSPHKMNVSDELTRLIPDWSPRLLALDPTSPYYFSKLNVEGNDDDDLNLLAYLRAGRLRSEKCSTLSFVC
jgi:hypothetical protein